MKTIVYFDIDGTLLDRSKNITLSDATVAAIGELKQNGHLVGINTGRGFGFIPPEIKALNFDAYIAGCGTYVSYRGKMIINRVFSQHEVNRIVDIFRREELDMIMEGPEHVYFEEISFDPEIVEDTKLLFSDSHSLKHLKEDGIAANKISFVVKSPEKDRRIRKELVDMMNFILYPLYLREGLPHGFSKASGMQALECLIGNLHSVAFGDSVNDLEMLQHADMGIAMGDSDQAVKQISDAVALPLADEGIALMLKQLNLIKGTYVS